ncbi:ATP-binding protein [Lysobacter sp. CA196]|uniref:ATP-binding protein n=1 Tax=Lysobacter sp. CA196 TaxID=3455606 RepID=UPI003F8D35C8
MNAFLAPTAPAFAETPFTAPAHLKLALYAVIASIAEACTDGEIDDAVQAYPFLADYIEEIEREIAAGPCLSARWKTALSEWEGRAEAQAPRLPLSALRRAGLNPLDIELLLAIGLIEEDPRFGLVFEQAQRRDNRPSFGLLMAWWRERDDGEDRIDDVRKSLQSLIEHGLVQLSNPEAPRPDWTPSVTLAVWDGLRGELSSTRWLRHVAHAQLPRLSDYVFPVASLDGQAILDALHTGASAPALLIRGPVHNGRKTLAGALAHALGKDLLIASAAVFDEETRWRLFGTLAAMLDALPVVEADSSPGETRRLAPLPLVDTPLFVVTGRHGAWACEDRRPMLDIELPLPGPAQRQRHWSACLPEQSVETLADLSGRMRLSSGHVRQVAAAANAFARLAQRERPQHDDLRRACRSLQTARLETLATRLHAAGSLDDLIVDDATREEIDALATRCRWREPLASGSAAVAMHGVGVRALFAGSSGTGKTLAARLLAAELGKDVYRIDLSATVNKYLGETEKNLDHALSAAEELDVVLLLDEGDALMANRTEVGSSHDRYANLETNFLLQRIESFEGILLVTSNAADRIDRAFARRMDVVVNFRAPDAWRRYEILRLHLAGDGCDESWLQDAASRCALSGGQWRNVVMHARLLALQSGNSIAAVHLQAALTREYRKIGANCPMRALDPPRGGPGH